RQGSEVRRHKFERGRRGKLGFLATAEGKRHHRGADRGPVTRAGVARLNTAAENSLTSQGWPTASQSSPHRPVPTAGGFYLIEASALRFPPEPHAARVASRRPHFGPRWHDRSRSNFGGSPRSRSPGRGSPLSGAGSRRSDRR